MTRSVGRYLNQCGKVPLWLEGWTRSGRGVAKKRNLQLWFFYCKICLNPKGFGFGAITSPESSVRKHRNLMFRCFWHRNIPDSYGRGAVSVYMNATESLTF